MSHSTNHAHETAVSPDGLDAWHTHTAEERPQEAHAEQIDSKSVLVFGVGGFLIVVGAVVATVVYFNWYLTQMKTLRIEYPEKVATADLSKAPPIQAEALARRSEILDTQFKSKQYAVTRPEVGTVRLPIEDAMKKVEDNYAKPMSK